MEKKVCTQCDKEKLLSEFLFRNKKEKIYHASCKLCFKEIRKKSYNKNKTSTYERNKRNRSKVRDWYIEYKLNISCTRCPENHISCLEFHHLESDDKDNNIATMVYSGYSITAIKKEISKCIVLCSNCHRKEHHK